MLGSTVDTAQLNNKVVQRFNGSFGFSSKKNASHFIVFKIIFCYPVTNISS